VDLEVIGKSINNGEIGSSMGWDIKWKITHLLSIGRLDLCIFLGKQINIDVFFQKKKNVDVLFNMIYVVDVHYLDFQLPPTEVS